MPRPSRDEPRAAPGPLAGAARRSGLTAIVTALPEELAPLLERSSGVAARRLGPSRVFVGRLGGSPVVLGVAGAGPFRAERGVRALLEAFPVTRLVGAGVAGGLSPGLESGEILVGTTVRDGASALDPDASWLARALARGPGWRSAVLVTVSELLPDRGAKAALYGRLAVGGAAAVDMESAAWARAAVERGVPCVVLRSVLDRAEDDLPEVLAGCQDPDGGLSRGKVVRRALLRPGAVSDLLSMRRQVRRCAARLAEAVERLVAEDVAPPPAPDGGS